MRKFTAVACLALGLTIPNVATAAPIGPVGCVAGLTCDISIDDVTGYTLLDNATAVLGFSPGWLVGYTFLLNAGANTADGIVASEVAQALVIGADSIELYTSLFGGFSTIVSNALGGVGIGGTSLSLGQIVGTPVFDGVDQLNGVGTFVTAPVVTMAINWGDAAAGGADVLRVTTVGNGPPTDPGPAPVPEPGSITLLALGGALAFMTVRRRQRAGRIQ